eukprot:Nitzschia sp. Nitz4//scaffold9_size221794//117221//118030//NITZ4_001355-RA/size221794-processed-gene-0.330-mRNA-1//-1//CDS//3329561028//7410//frame0
MSSPSSFEPQPRVIPPATLVFFSTCVGVFILQVVLNLDIFKLSMCPYLVAQSGQVYRIVTSVFTHGGVAHIVVNSLATLTLTSRLERHLGTVPLFVSSLWAILWNGVFYMLVAWLLHVVFQYDTPWTQHSVGFSGVLFYHLVLECMALGPNQSRRLFGIVAVPASVYPFVLLIALQLLIPNVSSIGHFSGIVTGYLKHFGFLPLTATGPDWDDGLIGGALQRLPGFVAAPMEDNSPQLVAGNDEGDLVYSSLSQCISIVRKCCQMWKWN